MEDRRRLCDEHNKRLDLLNGQVIELQREVKEHRQDTKLIVERQTEIKSLIEEQRDREAVKRYVKKISAIVIGLAAFATAIGTVITKAKFW